MQQAGGNNILILSFFFPPCNKVGGRRWAKFAKHLLALGHNVNVICVDYPYTGICPWEGDIRTFEKKVVRIPYKEHRPFYQIDRSPDTLSGKIRYRLSWYGDKYLSRKVKGDAQDISLSYGIQLRTIASEIIEKNKIDHIIITGGPFQWCYDAIQLKRKYDRIKFVLDLRDFWTGGENYNKLNDQNKATEDVKEYECIQLADVITTPAERIKEFLHDKYKSFKNKIHILPHAYDGSEMKGVELNKSGSNKEFSMAYAGILYSNMESSILQLIKLMKTMTTSSITIKLDLFSFDKSYRLMFEDNGLTKLVNYFEPLPAKQLFSKLSEYDVLLQLRAGNSQEQHFKSTKFYELIALRKPILYFGPEGDVSQFIVSNKLGFSGNQDPTALSAVLIANKKDPTIPNKNFDVSEYEFGFVTKQLLQYL